MTVCVVGLLFAGGYDVRSIIRECLEAFRSAGPAVFFLGMAILPALGVPLTFFTLTAGTLFGPQIGMLPVVGLALAAIAANMALGYFLAASVLRPTLHRLAVRVGYSLPEVRSGDMSDVIVLLRVTPGIPFPMQNYLLGLAAAPFTRYMVVSCLIAFPLNAAIIVLGEALLEGRGRVALFGLLLVVAALTAIHLVRKHYKLKVANPEP